MPSRKTIILTGASQGLGAATAYWLATQGAALVLVARSKDRLGMVAGQVRKLGGTPVVLPADVADPQACRYIVDTAVSQFQGIDALINNAGIISPLAAVANSDIAQWRYAIEVNLLGVYYLTRYALPHLINSKGRIVNISSGAAHTPIPSATAYCASKAALTHFTNTLAQETPDITAVSMRPGVVDTPMQTQIRRDGQTVMSSEQYRYYSDLKTNQQLEPPEIPARSVAWLALYAPNEMSGEFRNYDDPDIQKPSQENYGTTLGTDV